MRDCRIFFLGVSGRGSAPSVCDIWAMRDDGPPGSTRCRAGQCLEFGHEGFEVSASDRGAVQGLQLGGIGDQLDFFAQALRNSIESDFYDFEDSSLVGSDEAFLATFLAELFGE